MKGEDSKLRFGRFVVYPCSWGVCRARDWKNPANHLEPDERVTLIPFDTATTSATAWRDLRALLNWLDPGAGRWARACYKQMRRYHDKSRAKEWQEVLPAAIVTWAARRIDEASADDDCVDNTRVARVGNTAQSRRYEAQLSRGCCGFQDWTERGPDGRMYRIGYNHGH